MASDGLQVPYRTAGSGPIHILFVHGLGADSSCWCRSPCYFAPERFTLVFPDLLGVDTNKAVPTGTCSMEDMAMGIEDVWVALRQPRLHVVSHSMGCIPSLLFCERQPSAVATFATAEGNLGPDDATMSRRIAQMGEVDFVRAYAKWTRLLDGALGREAPQQSRLFLEALAKVPPFCLYRAARSCFEWSVNGELLSRFARLPCPRAYIAGEWTIQRRGGLPSIDATAVLVVRAQGHFMMESAGEFYPWIRDWVERATVLGGP